MKRLVQKLLSPFNRFGTNRSKSEDQEPPSKPQLASLLGVKGSLETADRKRPAHSASEAKRLTALTGTPHFAPPYPDAAHDPFNALLGAEVRKRLDAGHEHVRIDAISPEDAEYLPAENLILLGEPDAPPMFEHVTLKPGDGFPVEAGCYIEHAHGLLIRVRHPDGRTTTIHPVLT